MKLLNFAIKDNIIQTIRGKEEVKYSINIEGGSRLTATILPKVEIVPKLEYPLVTIKKYEIRPEKNLSDKLSCSYEGQGYFDNDGILHHHGQGKFIQYKQKEQEIFIYEGNWQNNIFVSGSFKKKEGKKLVAEFIGNFLENDGSPTPYNGTMYDYKQNKSWPIKNGEIESDNPTIQDIRKDETRFEDCIENKYNGKFITIKDLGDKKEICCQGQIVVINDRLALIDGSLEDNKDKNDQISYEDLDRLIGYGQIISAIIKDQDTLFHDEKKEFLFDNFYQDRKKYEIFKKAFKLVGEIDIEKKDKIIKVIDQITQEKYDFVDNEGREQMITPPIDQIFYLIIPVEISPGKDMPPPPPARTAPYITQSPSPTASNIIF